MTDDTGRAGLKRRTRIAAARATLREAVAPHDRTETRPVGAADGRALAAAAAARRPVPGYDRVAADGHAVRAADTFGAGGRSPAVLRPVEGSVGPGEAVRVTAGDELPGGADAVARLADAERVGGVLELFGAVTEGENVDPAGSDADEGERLFDAGDRLRPSDLGLLRAAGHATVDLRDRPTVAVVPTGDGLVADAPDGGEIVETDGLTAARLVERWGGDATVRDPVPGDRSAIRAALATVDADLAVTTGGTSAGDAAVGALGEPLVHGLALSPGRTAALGAVGDTPAVLLPGDPVACLVAAAHLLRPAVRRAGGLPGDGAPAVAATLARKIASEPGVRTAAPVRLEPSAGRERATGADGGAGSREAAPTGVGDDTDRSSVARADGWVTVAEDREGIAAGERVGVERWEVCA